MKWVSNYWLSVDNITVCNENIAWRTELCSRANNCYDEDHGVSEENRKTWCIREVCSHGMQAAGVKVIVDISMKFSDTFQQQLYWSGLHSVTACWYVSMVWFCSKAILSFRCSVSRTNRKSQKGMYPFLSLVIDSKEISTIILLVMYTFVIGVNQHNRKFTPWVLMFSQ